MKKLSSILVTIPFLIYGSLTFSQTISIIYIEGEVKTTSAFGKLENAVNLVYGPITLDNRLILPNKSTVKLIRNDGFFKVLNGPGSFLVKDLSFEKTEEKSTLNAFVNYFSSFFVSHSNSESKAQYTNSISAISKGTVILPPLLEYPFPGALPLIKKSMEFSWSSKCDTCTFELIIQDLISKEIILNIETKDLNYQLKNPSKYLSINKNYLWYVNTKYLNLTSLHQLFNITDYKEYSSKISGLEKSFKKNNPFVSPASKMAGIFAALEQEQLINYMILYGRKQIKKYSKDQHVNDIYDRAYYDHLRRRRI